MTLNSLRFRALRLLWTTAQVKVNKTLNMLTMLGIVMAAPYLLIASTPTGAYQTVYTFSNSLLSFWGGGGSPYPLYQQRG